jgi:hypothetical protein
MTPPSKKKRLKRSSQGISHRSSDKSFVPTSIKAARRFIGRIISRHRDRVCQVHFTECHAANRLRVLVGQPSDWWSAVLHSETAVPHMHKGFLTKSYVVYVIVRQRASHFERMLVRLSRFTRHLTNELFLVTISLSQLVLSFRFEWHPSLSKLYAFGSYVSPSRNASRLIVYLRKSTFRINHSWMSSHRTPITSIYEVSCGRRSASHRWENAMDIKRSPKNRFCTFPIGVRDGVIHSRSNHIDSNKQEENRKTFIIRKN